jgi:hypothetical protein
MTFGAGEQILSNWMEENAFVVWLEHWPRGRSSDN